jgi:DNA-binding GntR family transcriptional regulator
MDLLLEKIKTTDLRPMREIVLERLRKAILEGSLKQGDRLVETVVAENMGVSRTPVREAFRQLEIEGLAENLPRKGTVVKGLSKQDITEIYEIREMLEGLEVRLACSRISEEQIGVLSEKISKMENCINNQDTSEYWKLHAEFHKILLTASGNRRVIDQLNQINEYLAKLRNSTLVMDNRRYQALEEHKAIVEAFRRRDEALAEKVGRVHVVNAMKFLAEKIRLF